GELEREIRARARQTAERPDEVRRSGCIARINLIPEELLRQGATRSAISPCVASKEQSNRRASTHRDHGSGSSVDVRQHSTFCRCYKTSNPRLRRCAVRSLVALVAALHLEQAAHFRKIFFERGRIRN